MISYTQASTPLTARILYVSILCLAPIDLQFPILKSLSDRIAMVCFFAFWCHCLGQWKESVKSSQVKSKEE